MQIKISESQFKKIRSILEQDQEKRLLTGPFKCLEYTKMDIGTGKKMGRRFPLIFRYGDGDRVLEFGKINLGGVVVDSAMSFQIIQGDKKYQIIATFECKGENLHVMDMKNAVFINGVAGNVNDHINNPPTKSNYTTLQELENVIKNINWK